MYTNIKDLTKKDIRNIKEMDLIGLSRRLIAKGYKLRYKDLMKILPEERPIVPKMYRFNPNEDGRR